MRRPTPLVRERGCYCCLNGIQDIDYKDIRLLQKFMSGHAKILSRRRSGLCLKHQHKVALAVKRARFMALVPFVVK